MIDNEAPMSRRKDEEQKEEREGMNGAGEAALVAAREPKSIYGLIWKFVDRFGLPAVGCVALCYYVFWLTSSHVAAAKVAHAEFREAMREQTSAVKESTAEQRKMTEAVIRMDKTLDDHMKVEERRHR